MRDSKTEQFLDHGQYKYSYQERVEFSDIALDASQENPSRLLRRLNEDLAISYGLAMQDGDKFPAIVLLQLAADQPKKYLIATGVHRVKGAELIEQHYFDAYVVIEPDVYREEVLIRQLNTIEGQGVSITDRIAQVLLLHEKYPDKTLTTLAREWRLNEKSVKLSHSAEQALKRGLRFGYDFSKAKLSRTIQVGLNGIHSDVVFQRAAQFALTPSVSPGDIEAMIKEIRKAPREESAGLAIINQRMDELVQRTIHAKARHGRISPTAATNLIANCRRILSQIEKGVENLHLAALNNPADALIVVDDTVKWLKSVATELDRIRRLGALAAA
jgi:hypothetical protein